MNKSLIAVLTASPMLLHAQEKKVTPKVDKEIDFSVKGVFGEAHPYSPTLGFTLAKSPETTLKEHVEVALIESKKVTEALEKEVRKGKGGDKLSQEEVDKKVEELKKEKLGVPVWDDEKGLTFLNAEEYEKHRLTSSLRIYRNYGLPNQAEEGSAILVGIRDSFSLYNYSQEGLALDYTSNDGNDTLKLKGALIGDIYWDPWYNRGFKAPWNNDHYRFSVKSGVEFNTDDTAKEPVDQTSVYLLANFQSNPDLDADLFGIESLGQITSPQFLQVGVAWDHEDITGEDDLRWIVNWQPRFYLLNDWGFFARSFGINTLMRFEKDKFFTLNKEPVRDPEAKQRDPRKEAQLIDQSETDTKESPWYSFIPADIELAGGSDVWDALSGGGEDLDKVTLEWKLGFTIGNSDLGVRAGYLAEGVSPISDVGNTHIGHSIFAEMGLGNFTGKIAGEDGPEKPVALPKADIGAATLFAKYTFGEHAPDFKDEDMFQVGLRMRF